MKPLVLLSNDDGVDAPGLSHLINVVCNLDCDVFVCAPQNPHSGMSHSITMTKPIFVNKLQEKEGLTIYSCSGTPADSVKLALDKLVPRKPDFVFSGINHGPNYSISVIYSGTMAAAIEATLNGYTAAGFSVIEHNKDADFSTAMHYTKVIIEKIIKHGLPKETTLNVNFPAIPLKEAKGIKICRQSKGVWKEEFVKRYTPANQEYYWLTGDFYNEEPSHSTDTDHYALMNGYVSIVPIQTDLTANKQLQELKFFEN